MIGFSITLFVSLVTTINTQLFQYKPYDYCDPKLKLCELPTDHTMCKFPTPGLSHRCTPDLQEPLDATEKKRILLLHNKFRSNVANGLERMKNRKLPTSSNMRQLYWDKELEAIAARWAEQCVNSSNAKLFDKCRNTKRFSVSQNVGTRRVNGTTIEKQASQMVISWYKESKEFDPALIDKFVLSGDDKIAWKQFANIIWANTYAIGCARVIFQENLPSADDSLKKTSVWTVERLVCNYGPAGNEIGKPVYKRGVSCQDCPNGTVCSVGIPGLCAIQDDDKNLEIPESKEDNKSEMGVSTKIYGQAKDFANADSNMPTEESDAEKEEDGLHASTEIDFENESVDRKTVSQCSGDDCRRHDSTKGDTTTSSDFKHHKIEEIMNSPKGTDDKYIIRPGVYFNGKCHCAEVYRSRGRRQSKINDLQIFTIFLGYSLVNLFKSYF